MTALCVALMLMMGGLGGLSPQAKNKSTSVSSFYRIARWRIFCAKSGVLRLLNVFKFIDYF